MTKVEIFRRINAQHPEIVERLIGHWGTSELQGYVEELAQGGQGSSGTLASDLLEEIQLLLAEHRKEFPQFAAAHDTQIEACLDNNEHLRVISEHFPHIAKRLRVTWGRKAFAEYVNELLNDTRGGKRKGFPPDVLFALQKIVAEHDRHNPHCAVVVRDIWSIGGAGE